TRCVRVAASPRTSWCVQSYDLAEESTPGALWLRRCGGRSCVLCEVIRCGGDARAARCATCFASARAAHFASLRGRPVHAPRDRFAAPRRVPNATRRRCVPRTAPRSAVHDLRHDAPMIHGTATSRGRRGGGNASCPV